MTEQNITVHKGRGALDAFLNLLSLITVIWLAYSIGAVFFQLINKYLGNLDPAFGIAYVNYYALKLSIASLIVVAPVYFFVLNILHRKYKREELDHGSGVYRWLTYLMLLISALTIIGSLIALISGFLNGNYTANVILKILAIIIIAGFVFGYYFFDLKRRDYFKVHPVSMATGIIVGLVILFAIVLGFMNVPTPETARNQLLDSQKTQALANVYSFVIDGYQNKSELKDALDLTQLQSLAAPGTYDDITYRKIDSKNFELCATFKAQAEPNYNQPYASYPAAYGPSTPWLNHPAGKQCYSFDVAKEVLKMYPVSSAPSATDKAAQIAQPIK